MSVKFNVVERGKPGSPETPKKFYPSIVASGKVNQRDVAKRASEMSTVSGADTAAVVENFLLIIAQELAKGNIVQLGEFGSFWLRTETEGADDAESVRASRLRMSWCVSRPARSSSRCWMRLSLKRHKK